MVFLPPNRHFLSLNPLIPQYLNASLNQYLNPSTNAYLNTSIE